MGPEGSLLSSQKLATEVYRDTDGSSLLSYTLLPSQLSFNFQIIFCIPPKILCTFNTFPDVPHSPVISLSLIRSSCNYLHVHETSSSWSTYSLQRPQPMFFA
jgi:hypothetical protein